MTLSRDRQSSFKTFIRVGASRCAERGVGGRSSGGGKGFPKSSEGWPLDHQNPSPKTEKPRSRPRGCIATPIAWQTGHTHNPHSHSHHSDTVGRTWTHREEFRGPTILCVAHPLGSTFVRRGLCCYLSGLSVTLQGDSCKMLARQQSLSAWSAVTQCVVSDH